MQTIKQINLSGHPTMFRLNEDAHDTLRQYLEQARLSLQNDPDYEDVLRDVEQSIGEKLAARMRSGEQIITLTDVKTVLELVGPVKSGDLHDANDLKDIPQGKRRLCRIQEGQNIFGVCQGLAAYSGIDVNWVRTIFFALAGITGGLFLLVYLALGFFLPVYPTRADNVKATLNQS